MSRSRGRHSCIIHTFDKARVTGSLLKETVVTHWMCFQSRKAGTMPFSTAPPECKQRTGELETAHSYPTRSTIRQQDSNWKPPLHNQVVTMRDSQGGSQSAPSIPDHDLQRVANAFFFS